MIRILYIAAAGEKGGAEAVLLNILRHVDRSQYEPTVVCLRDGSFVEELRTRAGVDVAVVPAERFRAIGRAWGVVGRLREIMRSRRIDLVHCNGTTPHLLGGLAARSCSIPSIYHLHDVVEWSWSGQGVIHLLAVLVPATATIATSHYVARRFQESWRAAGNIQVIHNAVELEEAGDWDGTERVREEYGWPAGVPLAVWCGRLQRWKGAHIFLQAAAIVKRQIPAARFLVIGGALFGLDCAYEGELQAVAKRLTLDGCLHFTGHQRDARRLMAAADVVVHSSIRPDPFGLVILEAMGLGKPVIASDDGGPREIVRPGVTGLLVPPGDPEGLAAAMLTLLQAHTLRAEMGRAAKDHVQRSFDMSRMMDRLEGLYRRLVQPPKMPHAVARS